MNVNEIISSGLLELYAAGLTSGTESAQVAQWLKEYPEVAAAYEEIQSGIEAFARSGAITPPPAVKARIFSEIRQPGHGKVSGKVVKMAVAWKWLGAASIVLLLCSGWMNYLLYMKYRTSSAEARNAQQELNTARNKVNSMQQDMDIVQSRYSEVVRLNGVTSSPDATAKLFWMKNTGDVYIDASNLPDIPAEQQYQLWAIVDNKPVDAGLIMTGSRNDRYRIQKMKSFGAVNAFAITIEKKGGSVTPTLNQMVVHGDIQKKL